MYKQKGSVTFLCLIFCLFLIFIIGCDDNEKQIELERERLALEKEKIELAKLKKDAELREEQERIEATKPWWEKELAKVKGGGKPKAKNLFEAIENNDVEDVMNLIQHGANVNQDIRPDLKSYDSYPLHKAVSGGNVVITALLLSQGANVNREQINGKNKYYYPIHLAVKSDKNGADMVRLLLENGADVNSKCKILGNYYTPLAYIGNHVDHPNAVEIVKVLKEYGGKY